MILGVSAFISQIRSIPCEFSHENLYIFNYILVGQKWTLSVTHHNYITILSLTKFSNHEFWVKVNRNLWKIPLNLWYFSFPRNALCQISMFIDVYGNYSHLLIRNFQLCHSSSHKWFFAQPLYQLLDLDLRSFLWWATIHVYQINIGLYP